MLLDAKGVLDEAEPLSVPPRAAGIPQAIEVAANVRAWPLATRTGHQVKKRPHPTIQAHAGWLRTCARAALPKTRFASASPPKRGGRYQI